MGAASQPVQEQLQQELRGSVVRAINARRPILTHVNADSTWLLQLPCPPSRPTPAGRAHFNILIDPWLTGPQSDVAAWFSTQWHAIPPSVQTIAELEERLREVEEISREAGVRRARELRSPLETVTSFIDAVAICHEFTDHCHEATLREIHPSVPVFAVDKAAELISSWDHFENVYTTPNFSPENPDWRTTSISPLPDWIGISRIISPENALYYHSALLIAVVPAALPEGWPSNGADAIIYSPHGIAATDLAHVADSKPYIHTLALLHGLHDVSLPRFQLNLGAHNGLQAHRILQPRYWAASHDEQKKGGGVVAFFLRRLIIPLSEAVDKAQQEAAELNNKDIEWLRTVNFMEMQSGESLLLE